jgi:hypothetical protein
MSTVQHEPTSDPAALEQLPAATPEADLVDPTCATTGLPNSPDPTAAASGVEEEADQASEEADQAG